MISVRNCHPWCTSGCCVVDQISAMRKRESINYQCTTSKHFFSQPEFRIVSINNDGVKSNWRGKVCNWSYAIVDYFELSRQTVAISLDLFDRFFAKRGNECDERCVLMASLTTLFIAIKMNETKKVRSCTLTQLCIEDFHHEDITLMEITILKSLKWMVNPPTTVDFIHQAFRLLPVNIGAPVRSAILELSCYLAELSVCDSFFVGIPRSVIAVAAISNVLDCNVCPLYFSIVCQEEYISNLYLCLKLDYGEDEVDFVRKRLHNILQAQNVDGIIG